MVTNYRLAKYRRLKEKKKKWYGKQAPLFCKALGVDVHFTSKGFNHLFRHRDGRPRKLNERIHKLEHLPGIIAVLSIAEKEVRIDKFKDKKGKPVTQWGFVETVGFNRVKIQVVVQQIGKNGQHHFWSVYGVK